MDHQHSFHFRCPIPRGTPLNDPANPQLLVAESEIPFWGELVSYEAKVFRNGSAADDVSTYSVGVRKIGGAHSLKFQIWDRTVSTVMDCDYVVDAHFHIRCHF